MAAAYLCADTFRALLLHHQRLRVLQVLGQSNRRLLGRLARRARKCDLFATFLRDELGVELARAQLDDVLVASLALAELELVCDAVVGRHLLHPARRWRRLRICRRLAGGFESAERAFTPPTHTLHLYLCFIHTLVLSSAGLTQLGGSESPWGGCRQAEPSLSPRSGKF